MPTLATPIEILSTSLWAYFKSYGCFFLKKLGVSLLWSLSRLLIVRRFRMSTFMEIASNHKPLIIRKFKKTIGKHYSLLLLPVTPSSPSWTLERLFELTRCPSRALNSPRALLTVLHRCGVLWRAGNSTHTIPFALRATQKEVCLYAERLPSFLMLR